MGSSIKHSNFSDEDYAEFSRRLQNNLKTLAKLLEQPGFGVGSHSLGAELELSLINSDFQASWTNQQLIDLANDPQLTLELNRYNLEYNLAPLMASGSPFSTITQAITEKLTQLNQLAAPLGVRTASIGILPTLTRQDINEEATSDYIRYRVLTESIQASRGSPFNIDINGPDPISLTLSDPNAEGANTSFQIHLRVNPDEFTNCYNAAQAASALGLAISTNSPLFLGHQLWEETRVPLFKQAVETRNHGEIEDQQTARTGLGSGWITGGALELFKRSVDNFSILLPECIEHKTSDSHTPELFELRLHHGTIWHWNRAIYDSADNGHLRIELRALPSGPSPIDMAASAAFLVGLTKALSHQMNSFVQQISFNQIKSNFYRAAEKGLDAVITWPEEHGGLQQQSAAQLIEKLIPLARQGLEELNIDQHEINTMLDIIQHRLEQKITGARWQLQKLSLLEQDMNRTDALAAMLRCYLEHSDSGKPVHQWSLV